MPRKSGLPAGYRLRVLENVDLSRHRYQFVDHSIGVAEAFVSPLGADGKPLREDVPVTWTVTFRSNEVQQSCNLAGCAGSCPICRPRYVDKARMTVCELEPRGWWARVKRWFEQARNWSTWP